jgi:DNA polymerase-3 subunit epsilon
MYAVIDLEATGGKPSEERIIEVAIFLYDGKDIVDQFISLINPDCPIPPFVQKLTGIKQRDVQGAPRFHEVAKRIVQMTEGAIFVAHNAPFDYRVLREEFARLGYDYQRTVLDTIPLAQKFIPDLPAYGLATLCEELGITNAKRHRADGDARATVKLLEILLEKDREKYIEGVYLKQPSATGKHPFSKQIEPLVKTTGIYYLFNEDGTVIYIGKSDQLRVRIDRHFLSTNEKALALQNEVKSLRVEETGSLVLAEILEHLALKKLRPAYNTPKDKYSLRMGVFPVESADGGILWDLRGIRREQPILQVKDLAAGYALLARLAVRGGHTPETIALPKHIGGVAKAMRALDFEGQDVQALGGSLTGSLALDRIRESIWPASRMVLTDKGRKPGVKTVFLVDEGRFIGYTTSDLASELKDFTLLKKKCTPVEDGGPYLNSLLADAFWAGRLQKV